ncbi:hypothetical protein K190097F3_06080 [Enterocloster clostridioformis]|uniref:Uncharacterized protein n=1 Tax=Enterocloster clostridioformis TaxID=1531 RepID=A0A829WPE5_9FIRM|nr:hypothetical protein Ccl03g_50930 [Enterocloster clostridioformis]
MLFGFYVNYHNGIPPYYSHTFHYNHVFVFSAITIQLVNPYVKYYN